MIQDFYNSLSVKWMHQNYLTQTHKITSVVGCFVPVICLTLFDVAVILTVVVLH